MTGCDKFVSLTIREVFPEYEVVGKLDGFSVSNTNSASEA
jgi:hypothetical protein